MWCKRCDCYELWQEPKQLKLFKITKAWPYVITRLYTFPTSTQSGNWETEDCLVPFSYMMKKAISVSMKINQQLCKKEELPFTSLKEVVGTETIARSGFLIVEKATEEQILELQDRNKSYNLYHDSHNQVSELHLMSKVFWKIIIEFTRSISSTRMGQPVLLMDVQISKNKYISRGVDWENCLYKMYQMGTKMNRWKRSRALNKVKPI